MGFDPGNDSGKRRLWQDFLDLQQSRRGTEWKIELSEKIER